MKKFIFLLITLVLAGWACYSVCNISEVNKKLIEEPLPIKLEQPEFFLYDTPNDTLILQACAYYGLKHDSIILTQAKLETGNYKSYQCKVNNNLFGLYNSAKGEYYKFNHWSESVEAYKNWIQYRYKDGEDYYYFLTRIGYAEDPHYNSKLKWIKQTI